MRSTRATRLKRIKPGFFNPPGGRPIFVPGDHWLQVLVCGLQGAPGLAHLCVWTTRGERTSSKREEEGQVLSEVARRWGSRVVHVWNRGFAGTPWLTLAYVLPSALCCAGPKPIVGSMTRVRHAKPGSSAGASVRSIIV